MTSPTPPASYMSAAAYRPPGPHVGDQRRPVRDLAELVERQRDAELARRSPAGGARRWCEPPVAATDAIAFSSDCRVTSRARADVVVDERHHQLAGPARGLVLAPGPRPGSPLRPAGREAQELEHGGHRVGRELAAARAGARAGAVLDLVQLLERDLARAVGADRLVHGDDVRRLALVRARVDRAVVEDEPRDVEAAEGHRAGRDRLVAADQAHEPVEQVAARDELDRVGDDLAADRATPSCPRCPSTRRR